MRNLMPWRKPVEQLPLDPEVIAALSVTAGRVGVAHHEERLKNAYRVRTVQRDARGNVTGSVETTYEEMSEFTSDDWLQ